VFARFVAKSPFSVMPRATLEHLFADSFLDQLFAEHAHVQYHQKLAFSAVTALLSQVVLRYRPALRAAYQRQGGAAATLKSVYLKLQQVEPAVCAALVAQTAARAQPVLDGWPQARRPDPIAGLRLRILDGNHLGGTQHRLQALRGEGAAALPGLSVVLRDDRTGLLQRLACCEDAYTNERALAEELRGWVEADDLIVADRTYCWCEFLRGLAQRGAYCVIRHHRKVALTAVTAPRYGGRTPTGEVYEQAVEIGPPGPRLRLRCVVVQLYTPTQEGDTQIRLLRNVPPDRASAVVLAEVYRRRWSIERSFQELTEQLRCEVNTLGYPKAALFGFSLAVAAYNLLVVLKGALAAAHGQAKVEEELSTHALAQEIRQDSAGLGIALPEAFWQRFARRSGAALADWLEARARGLRWQASQKRQF
jgi:hypothetical protein